jgi:hypothetical protein
MYPMLVLAPVFGLAAYCLAQIVVCRSLPGRNPYISLASGMAAGFLTGLALTVFSLVNLHSGVWDAVGYLGINGCTYMALAFGYFNFVNLTIASLRIRVLQELAEAGGSMPTAQILAKYNTDSVIAFRLERLIGGGHLIERNDRIFSGKWRFLLLARIFDVMRAIVMGRGHLAIGKSS